MGLLRVRHERLHFHALEKEMATHSSVLAWRIPGTGEWAAVYGVAQSQTLLKRLSSSSSNAGDPVQSLGWKDPLEKEMATHSSTLAWKIPRTEEPVGYSP